MKPGGVQDLLPTANTSSPPSKGETRTTPLQVPTLSCNLSKADTAMKKTVMTKSFLSGRTTRILECRKIKKLKECTNFGEKSSEISQQPLLQATGIVGTEHHTTCTEGSNVALDADMAILQPYEQLTTSSDGSKDASDDELPLVQATGKVGTEHQTICTEASKDAIDADMAILQPYEQQNSSSDGSKDEHHDELPLLQATRKFGIEDQTICTEGSKDLLDADQPILQPTEQQTISSDESKEALDDEMEIMDDSEDGLYRNNYMQALFKRTFDKSKPVLSDAEGNAGNIRSTSTTMTGEEVLTTNSPYFLHNKSVKIEYTEDVPNVCEIFSNFSGEKAKLLRIIGFSGLCAFPVHESTDLRFYLWILSKVDVSSSTLDLGNKRTIPIQDCDINLITGLPFSGHSVLRGEKSPLIKKRNASKVKKYLSVGNLDGIFSVPYVEHLVRREYSSPMSEKDRYGFCIAATVLAVAGFLAVEAGAVRFPLELIDNLIDPLQIRSHNWSQLVRNSLISQASYVQNQISAGKHVIKVGGCPIVAKVFYLDNIEFGVNIVADYIFPRASVFSQEIVDKLITMDSKTNVHNKKSLYGNHEFKTRYKVFYSRKIEAQHIYLPPAYPDNKRKRDSAHEPTTLMQREQDARNGAVNSKGRQLSVGQLILKAEGKLTPRNERGQFKSKLSVDATSPVDERNLNIGIAAEYGDQVEQQQDEQPVPYSIDETGVYEDSTSKCLIFYNSLKGSRPNNLSCVYWYEHNLPTTIKINARVLCDETSKGRQYGNDYSDAISRMLTTWEDKKNEGSRKREKHYMPLSWSSIALNAKGFGNLRQYKEFFISEFYKYDVDKCRKIAAVVDAHGYRSCYIWDIVDKQVHVLDPLKMDCTCSTIKKLHEPVVGVLSQCLILCLREFFPSCKLDGLNWKIFYKNDTSKKCKWQNSGLYSFLYAQFYEGACLSDRIDMTDLGHFRARHLWEVLTMEGNVGSVPMALTCYKTGAYPEDEM